MAEEEGGGLPAARAQVPGTGVGTGTRYEVRSRPRTFVFAIVLVLSYLLLQFIIISSCEVAHFIYKPPPKE